jgi:hypothetical protein
MIQLSLSSRGEVRVREFFLEALSFRHISLLYLVPMSEIKCDCAVDGLEI